MLCILLVELISTAAGNPINCMTPEFISYFPSVTIAHGVNMVLYGIIGAGFAGWACIFEADRIGFVLQNLIFCVGAAIIWVPIVIFVWQLQNYPTALVMTVIGFFATYIIITIISYVPMKKQIREVNQKLEEEYRNKKAE